MIKITFPDGSVREYNEGVTGLQIAESISSRLAQDVLACGVNGEIYDLGRPIMQDAEVVLYKWEDEQGKHAFWHTSAHLLAEALQELYPGIQFGIGPAIETVSTMMWTRVKRLSRKLTCQPLRKRWLNWWLRKKRLSDKTLPRRML